MVDDERVRCRRCGWERATATGPCAACGHDPAATASPWAPPVSTPLDAGPDADAVPAAAADPVPEPTPSTVEPTDELTPTGPPSTPDGVDGGPQPTGWPAPDTGASPDGGPSAWVPPEQAPSGAGASGPAGSGPWSPPGAGAPVASAGASRSNTRTAVLVGGGVVAAILILVGAAVMIGRARDDGPTVAERSAPDELDRPRTPGGPPVRRTAVGSLIGRPLLGADVVFVLAEYGVAAVERASDRVRWDREVCYGPDWADPRRDDPLEVLVVVCDDHRLIGLDPVTGDERWSMPQADRSYALRTGGRSVVTFNGSSMWVHDLLTGRPRWSQAVGLARPVAVTGGRVIVGTGDGQVTSFDENTGTQQWIQAVPAHYVHIQGESVFVRTTDERLVELSVADGSVVWRSGGAVGAPDRVIVGATGGQIVLGGGGEVEAWGRTGTTPTWSTADVYTAFTGHDRVVTTDADALVVYDAATGAVQWSDDNANGAFAPSFDADTIAYVVRGRLHVRPLTG